MAAIWSRHPRYALLLFGRIARADAIYDKTLRDRAGLIHKFGPSPAQVAM
ncbi:hypothetical protein HDZ31DRAFT_51753 [Schizophyllum fasciatum]